MHPLERFALITITICTAVAVLGVVGLAFTVVRERRRRQSHVPGPEPEAEPEPAYTSITCQVCGLTSRHPEDVRQGYCGSCHGYTYGIKH